MYMIYWSETVNGAWVPHAQSFPSDALAEALRFAESQRQRQRAGEAVAFVTLCSENPDSVGPPGVADPPPDYSWRKRRP